MNITLKDYWKHCRNEVDMIVLDLKGIHNYPHTLILNSPFFLLEFSDVFKYRQGITKTEYFSKVMKSLPKYINASVEFLNNNLVNKIFEFRMPFCFEELEKEKNLIILMI